MRLLVGLLLCLSLGCSKNLSEAPAASSNSLKVGLLTAADAKGLLDPIRDELGASVEYRTAQDFQVRDSLAHFGSQGFDLVFAHDPSYKAAVEEAAKAHADTTYILTAAAPLEPQTPTLRFKLEQGAYLCGYMAGLLSRSKIAAAIGTEASRPLFDAFIAGAQAADPSAAVITAYLEFPEPDHVKGTALEAIGLGADFIIQDVGEAADGLFEICREHKVRALGLRKDQNDHPSGAVVASAFIDPAPAFLRVASLVKSGKLEKGMIEVGMKEGAVEFIFSPAHLSKIPADAQGKIAQKMNEVRSGAIKVPTELETD